MGVRRAAGRLLRMERNRPLSVADNVPVSGKVRLRRTPCFFCRGDDLCRACPGVLRPHYEQTAYLSVVVPWG